jgi:hypothetical protein
MKTKMEPRKNARNAKKVAVIPFNPGKEFFPRIDPYMRPAFMDRLFRIYRRTL